jgi:predicted Zn-dependent peptidase
MKRLFLLTILSLALLAPPAPLTPAAEAQVDDYRDIEFPPLADFEIPEPEVFELPNGMKIFLLEDHELPLVDLTARIRTGSIYEPADKVGLAAIAGAVQRTGGTRSMTGDEIDDFLESRAASVETGTSSTVGFAGMDSLADDFDEVLPIFVEVLRYPEFSEDKIELEKVQANSAIARRNDSVGAITGREFSKLIYGEDSPLARVEEYATIDAITRDDLMAWHGRFYHPNNIYIGVVGDFDSGEMKRKLTEAFADWQRGPDFDGGSLSVEGDDQAGVFFIEKSDVTQANIRLGHLGITYDNPDYFPVVVMNEVLGGGFSARLFSRIRSEQGLAYNVGGRVGASFLHPGVTSFSMSTKSETMGEAVDALFKEVRGMITEPATERELQLAKESLLNSFIFNYATKGQVLGQQMLFTYYGLPLDFLEKYRANIEKVTREEVMRVAEQYLHPDKAQLLVVGKAADFDRPMSSFGEVAEIDISIPPPPSNEVAVEVTDESLTAGAELLAQMAGAVGGESAADLAAFRTVDQVTVTTPNGPMQVRQEFLLALPDSFHVIIELPMGVQTMTVSDGGGSQSFQDQSRELPADQVEKQLADLGRNLLYLARFSESEEIEAVAGGSDEVGGVACRWLEVTLGASSRLCIDAEGLVLKQTYQSVHPFTQAPGSFEVLYSDYREVAGFRVPHKQVTSIDGAEFTTTTRETIEINPDVDPALFERPAA